MKSDRTWVWFVATFAVVAVFGSAQVYRGQKAESASAEPAPGSTDYGAPVTDIVDSTPDIAVEEQLSAIDQEIERAGLPYQIGDDGCVTKPYRGAFINPPDNCEYSNSGLFYCCPCGYTVIFAEPWCFNLTTGEAWGDEQPVPFLEVEAENMKPGDFAEEYGPPCHLCLHFVEYPGQTVVSTSQVVTCDQLLDLVEGFNAVVDHRM